MEVEEVVAKLIHDFSGVPLSQIRSDADLEGDIRLYGDDIVELFDKIEAQFGTDFSALRDRWFEYFHPEGNTLSKTSGIVLTFILGLAAILAAGWWSIPLALFCALSLYQTYLTWTGRWGPDQKHPVTVGDIVAAVKAGVWPSPAAGPG